MAAPASLIVRIGFGNVLVSEWTKLRSVRATYWTVALATLAAIALGIVISLQARHDLLDHKDSLVGFDSALTSLSGLYLAQVALGALGVVAITSEYGTGMIRATLSAVPQRRALLTAKAVVIAATTLVLGEVLSFGAYLLGQAVLEPAHAGGSLGQPDELRAAFGGGLYLTVIALFGFGLGALLRHTAATLSAFFGLMFAVVAIVDLLPTNWRNHIIEYLPANAGSRILTTVPSGSALSPWHGLLVLCLYPAAAISVAMLLVARRDA